MKKKNKNIKALCLFKFKYEIRIKDAQNIWYLFGFGLFSHNYRTFSYAEYQSFWYAEYLVWTNIELFGIPDIRPDRILKNFF